MDIKIGDRYNIRFDPRNWILQEKREIDKPKLDGPTHRYVDIGYWGNMDQLINRLLELELRTFEVESIDKLRKSLEQSVGVLKNEVERVRKGEGD